MNYLQEQYLDLVNRTYNGESMRQEICDAIKHAIDEYPNEACGLMVSGVYVPSKNIAPNPKFDFRIDPKCWISASIFGDTQYIIHSHNDLPTPSDMDIEEQKLSGLPWTIINIVNKQLRSIYSWGYK